jgi:hypothetical protein
MPVMTQTIAPTCRQQGVAVAAAWLVCCALHGFVVVVIVVVALLRVSVRVRVPCLSVRIRKATTSR